MCLYMSLPVSEEFKKVSPKKLKVYKVLNRYTDNILRSPFFYKVYEVGENKSNICNLELFKEHITSYYRYINQDEVPVYNGLHVYMDEKFARNVNFSVFSSYTTVIVEFEADMDDFIAINLYKTEAVFHKLTLTKEAYDLALSRSFQIECV